MDTRWTNADVPRGHDYDRRWERLAASGQNVHGEADFVEALLADAGGTRVLDAGCGTGRVAIELAARGFTTVGVDSDEAMVATAREKAPELTWLHADLSTPGSTPTEFDLALLAGNVMIFLAPGSEARVLAEITRSVRRGGLVVAGFSLRPDRLQLEDYDRHAHDAGLTLWQRFSTWDRAPFTGGDYAVSVHRR